MKKLLFLFLLLPSISFAQKRQKVTVDDQNRPKSIYYRAGRDQMVEYPNGYIYYKVIFTKDGTMRLKHYYKTRRFFENYKRTATKIEQK